MDATRTLRRLARAAALLSAAALLAAAASCGDVIGDRDDPNHLIVWHAFTSEEGEVFGEIVKEFEKDWESKNQGVDLRVDIEYIAYNDMFTKLRSAALARITPDVAFIDSIKITDLAFGQALVPINNLDGFKSRYGTIEGARGEFVKASFDAGVVNRLGETNLYGLPAQTTTVALFWNRTMFRDKAQELRQAGLDPSRAPRTWDELIAYGKVLNDADKGIHGYGLHGSLWFTFPILNMYGVKVIEYAESGRATAVWETENGEAAFDMVRKLSQSGTEGGAWKSGAQGPDQGFLNGIYAMCFTGPWKVQEYTNAKLDFDIAMIPAPDKAERELLDLAARGDAERLGDLAWSSSNVGGQTGAIMRSAVNPEVAYEFLEYFTGDPVQRQWASSLGQIPVRLSAWENLDMSKYPFIVKFMEQLALSERIPQIPLYGTLEEIFNREFNLFLAQPSMTSKEMLSRVEAGMDQQILGKVNEAVEE
ncbi:MAG: extracellular solute-binding protein [Candidatus Sumerlaeia bacterium]|nr:extracellular solute-binding protein [Candidatus Sumerlaeia bacterium]